MIRIYTQIQQGYRWLDRYSQQPPAFACIFGFTATGLIPGISAAGATPADRRRTALADAEFLARGAAAEYTYPLPPLTVGVSPAFLSRAVIETLQWPLYLFDAGLPVALANIPGIEAIALDGQQTAACLSSGHALPRDRAERLFQAGWDWGDRLGRQHPYILLGECVVGGTTTAQAILSGLGFAVTGKINSSHPTCNHAQKQAIVAAGLARAELPAPTAPDFDPIALAAAIGDPMQLAVAGMTLAASRHCGVLLAGGTQMLAVWALARCIARHRQIPLDPSRIAIGTTRWVACDASGDTAGLARLVGDVPLLAADADFSAARWPALQAYERGFVKEGVGAGGCAIAAHLQAAWTPARFLAATEALLARYAHNNRHGDNGCDRETAARYRGN